MKDITSADVIDTGIAHPARRYNYWLDGKDNFAADRVSGDMIASEFPAIGAAARANRRFLGRTVRYLVGDAGIRQFLDIGTGLPTAENTHEIAQSVAPESRIVYVDNDPLVLVHARALLTSTPKGRTAYIDADARVPESIMASPEMGIIDFDKPIAVMLVAVPHFFPEDAVVQHLIDTLMAPTRAGSHLVVSHAAAGLLDRGQEARVRAALAGEDFELRDRDGISAFAAGLEIIEPGVVPIQRWRPPPREEIPDDNTLGVLGFVARKPG